jgi:hypothetical protein
MTDERRKFWLGGLLLVVLAVALSAGWLMLRKPAHGMYGAISLSQTSLGYGTSWGYPDPVSANARAQKECARADCAVRINLSGTCAALVMSGEHNQSFAVADTDKASAGALALAQCQADGASDCAVQVDICGNGS